MSTMRRDFCTKHGEEYKGGRCLSCENDRYSESARSSEGLVGCSEWVGPQGWSAEPPRASGVWWWIGPRDRTAQVVEVKAEPWMEPMGLGPIMQWVGLTRTRNVTKVGGWWWGPVEQPKPPGVESGPTGRISDGEPKTL